jgi:hypothetical protein
LSLEIQNFFELALLNDPAPEGPTMSATLEEKAAAVKLDWTRLLGFDQAVCTADEAAVTKLTDPRLAKLGAKCGTKISRGR